MPRLIHLNGPPAIGKSTLAAIWADRHPGALNLDIDSLYRLVGGWRELGGRVHDILRPIALAMAAAHLRAGHDVILPTHLGEAAEIEEFERIAADHGADFHEIVLLADRAEAIRRFERRTDLTEWDLHNRAIVAELGGPDFLAALHDQVERIAERPSVVVIRSEPDAIEQTYEALEKGLDPRRCRYSTSG